VILAVNHDGDSDSTGSITGNLLGTLYGVDAIPQQWLEPLELREVIAEIAEDLLDCIEWPLSPFGSDSEMKAPDLAQVPGVLKAWRATPSVRRRTKRAALWPGSGVKRAESVPEAKAGALPGRVARGPTANSCSISNSLAVRGRCRDPVREGSH
jgi:hypothetical protein